MRSYLFVLWFSIDEIHKEVEATSVNFDLNLRTLKFSTHCGIKPNFRLMLSEAFRDSGVSSLECYWCISALPLDTVLYVVSLFSQFFLAVFFQILCQNRTMMFNSQVLKIMWTPVKPF